jgi:hypothetical protein
MPTQGCGEDGKGNCDVTPQEEARNLQHLAKLTKDVYKRQCAAGNTAYCDGDPVKIAAFTLTMWTGGALAESFILGGGAASTITAAWSTVYKTLVSGLTYWATQNPDSPFVSLGSNGAYQKIGNFWGYTYFDLGKAYDFLVDIGMRQLAEDVNSQFTANQIEEAKTFLVTVTTENPGPGTMAEMMQINASGLYTQITSSWSSFTHIFMPGSS